MGWGQTNYTLYWGSHVLRFGIVQTYSDAKCSIAYERFIYPEMICAIGDSNTYKGDSGGALVCANRLVGISVLGQQSEEKHPDVYTDVVYFYNWVHANSIEDKPKIGAGYYLLAIVAFSITIALIMKCIC